MRIIRSVKIKYFRSIYTASISGCKSLNVISGSNDAGKSNVLKALNLFFNGSTDWDASLNFQSDFSAQRLQQVRKETVKGKQFISISIEINRPPNYKRSLPPVFSVTRNWLRDSNIYQETNNLEHLKNRGLLPSKSDTAKRVLQHFLNRIHFEYVPAVKDRAYFSRLLSTLQARLLASPLDGSITPLLKTLASDIQGQIVQLQEDFKKATGLDTFIDPPGELASLFQSFVVSTGSAEGAVPLALHGDGIQARYVPSVLHYISALSSDFFIWGFEEPENSLEYSYITSLASDFEDTYAKDAQIFITTHSPALVALQGQETTCYRVFKVEDKTNIASVWPRKGSSPHKQLLDKEIGYIKIQQEIHKQYQDKFAEQHKQELEIRNLQDELLQYSTPLLLVEGIHDKQILEVVWPKLYPDDEIPFRIRVADPAANTAGGGAGGTGSVALMVEALHPEEGRKAIGLFDCDEEGLKEFSKLSHNFKSMPGKDNVKLHRNGFSYAIVLPCPQFRSDYIAAKNMTMELLFPDAVLNRKTSDGRGIVFSTPSLTIRLGRKQINPSHFDAPMLDQIQSLPGYQTIDSGKDVFAQEIIPDCTSDECISFLDLFQLIFELLEIQIVSN